MTLEMTTSSSMNASLEVSKWTSHNNMLLSAFLFWCNLQRVAATVKCQPNAVIPTATAVLNVDGKRLFFDYNDGFDLLPQALECDAYFKRSLTTKDYEAGIIPLGFHFNYSHRLLRLLTHAGFLSFQNKVEVFRSIDIVRISNMSHFDMSVNRLFQKPTDHGGRVIFLTRLWDPERHKDPEEKLRRQRMNQTRISLIRTLKAAGHSMVGVYPDAYAQKVCPDILLSKSQTTKRNYMAALRNADIGIANEGLKGSPGWKIGEYVAGAKAIISDRITSVVPEFEQFKHYLCFERSEQVLEHVNFLLEKRRYRDMQEANFDYSRRILHPRLYLPRLLESVR